MLHTIHILHALYIHYKHLYIFSCAKFLPISILCTVFHEEKKKGASAVPVRGVVFHRSWPGFRARNSLRSEFGCENEDVGRASPRGDKSRPQYMGSLGPC